MHHQEGSQCLEAEMAQGKHQNLWVWGTNHPKGFPGTHRGEGGCAGLHLLPGPAAGPLSVPLARPPARHCPASACPSACPGTPGSAGRTPGTSLSALQTAQLGASPGWPRGPFLPALPTLIFFLPLIHSKCLLGDYKGVSRSNVAQGGALEGRKCWERKHGECAVLSKICPWQRGF